MTSTSQIVKCFVAVVLFANFSLLEADRVTFARTKSSTFSDYTAFLQFYGHHAGEKTSSASYSHRRQLFETRKSEVDAHNAQNKSWKKAINLFSDFTAEELRSRLGYKRTGGRWEQSPSSFLEKQDTDIVQIDISKLATVVDWRNTLNASNFVHNQGDCGSCWAHAAVGALEAAAEIHTGFQGHLSTDQIIQCTANPRHCGGTGGCQGATSEMAFERAARYGILKLEEFERLKDGHCVQQTHPAIKVSSLVRLPENSASHLLHAVATHGPVVVSVDAGPIFAYGSGVFSGCEQDALVNHAAMAVGYGRQADKDYWLVKNSWGPNWGENGYFRVERHSDGTDRKPQEGVYCDNGPTEIKVCGMCGIYSDSTYPIIAGANNLATASNLATAKIHAL